MSPHLSRPLLVGLMILGLSGGIGSAFVTGVGTSSMTQIILTSVIAMVAMHYLCQKGSGYRVLASWGKTLCCPMAVGRLGVILSGGAPLKSASVELEVISCVGLCLTYAFVPWPWKLPKSTRPDCDLPDQD